MMVRNLVLMCAAMLACGATQAQTAAPAREKPSYDEALAAMARVGCERSEAERYLRFFCKEAETFWYFTRQGRPEHAIYMAAPAYLYVVGPFTPEPYIDGEVIAWPILGPVRSNAGDDSDQAREQIDALRAWIKDVHDVWFKDAAEMGVPSYRRRSRSYPLVPS